MNRVSYPVIAIIFLLLLSACGGELAEEAADTTSGNTIGQADSQPVEVVAENGGSDIGTQTPTEEPEESGEPEPVEVADVVAASERPSWQNLVLTDVRSGETFKLADFSGKSVFVEPMATWCSNCRRQLGNVKEAKQQVSPDDVIFVALSVETNIEDGTLANYADQAGFDWLFAVATPELLQELASEFGRGIANPPATPHFIIYPDGSFSDLVTGVESAAQIVPQLSIGQG